MSIRIIKVPNGVIVTKGMSDIQDITSDKIVAVFTDMGKLSKFVREYFQEKSAPNDE